MYRKPHICGPLRGMSFYVQSGFLGHMNDAGQYALMPNIGDGQHLDFLPDVYLLGDKGYANNYPILTRYQLGAGADRDIKIIFNTELSSRRVFVEHVISHFKTYRAVIKGIYRHMRWFQFMPVVADVCACLAQRRIRLQYNHNITMITVTDFALFLFNVEN